MARKCHLYLQLLCQEVPCYMRDNSNFVHQLCTTLPQLPPRIQHFTADTFGTYPDINTDHALSVLPNVLPDSVQGRVLHATICIIMTQSTFNLDTPTGFKFVGGQRDLSHLPLYNAI